MQPDLDPFDVNILLVGGSSVETTIEDFTSLDSLLAFLKQNAGRYPGWVLIGDVIVYSQNIVAIQPVYDDAEDSE